MVLKEFGNVPHLTTSLGQLDPNQSEVPLSSRRKEAPPRCAVVDVEVRFVCFPLGFLGDGR